MKEKSIKTSSAGISGEINGVKWQQHQSEK